MGRIGSFNPLCWLEGDPVVGEGTWVGPFVILDATGGLTIGKDCHISAGVTIHSHDSVKRCLSGGKEPVEKAPVVIGDRVYIGPNCVISKGVTIGDGAVIGACSFVNKDVPENTRVWGIPAIGFVDADKEEA